VLAIGGAALFSQADQAARIAEDAENLGDLQAAVAETSTHRAALVIAFASIDAVVPPVALEAIDEGLLAVGRIRDRLSEFPHLEAEAGALEATTAEVGRLLAADAPEAARRVVETDLLPAVGGLAQRLAEEAARIEGRIATEQARAGSLARAASFVVALLVPVLAVVLVRSAARRRLERDRLEAEVKRQRDLAEARDRLIAGLSHQLRTPITGIYGWSDILAHDPELVEEGTMAILGQAGDLRRMVDDIIVAARLDDDALAYRPQPTEISKVVAKALSHFRRIGSRLLVDCEDALVTVDGPRLEQAIHNLVSNAFLHGAPPIEVVGRINGQIYRLAVIDRGQGLPEHRSQDPFAPFAHAPEDITTANSLGLGLSVAASLARLVGGRLEYLRQDACSVFSLTVPLTSVPVPVPA